MKFNAILLIAAGVICYAEAQKCTIEVLGGVVKKCFADTEASEIDFLDILAMKPAYTDKGKCFRSCIMRDCDYLDDKGNVPAAFSKDSGLLLGGGDPEKIKKIEATAGACVESTKHQEDLCEYTEELIECIWNNCKACGIKVPDISL